MGFESFGNSEPANSQETPSFETSERQNLFDEKLQYENQLQRALNLENSIRDRYGADVKSEDAQREIADAQREQMMAQKMIDDVSHRLRDTKAE